MPENLRVLSSSLLCAGPGANKVVMFSASWLKKVLRKVPCDTAAATQTKRQMRF